jgi:hypothetical protein
MPDYGPLRNAWLWDAEALPQLMEAIQAGGPHRDPYWHDPDSEWISEAQHRHEIERARWAIAPQEGQSGLVSVIVACRNRAYAERLAATIGEAEDHELIWVCGGRAKPNVPGRVVPFGRESFTRAEAINRGATVANGSVYWIVDEAAAVTSAGAPERLLDLFARHPSLGAVVGDAPRESIADSDFVPDAASPASNSACFAIRRSAFELIGGLEERLGVADADVLVATAGLHRNGYKTGRTTAVTCRMEFAPAPERDFTPEHFQAAGVALGYGDGAERGWTMVES